MSSIKNSLDKLPVRNGFRLRGHQMTRLEAFSDSAFAFAMTMLVISVGNIPNSYAELITALKGIPTFTACFASIMAFWIAHRSWSRRFGLEDFTSTALSLLLIFIVLIYLYPLKIAFSAFFYWISTGWLPSNFRINNDIEMTGIFVIYGLGLAALSACMVLLNNRALKLKSDLQLNKYEINKTKAAIAPWVLMTITGFTSAILALLLPTKYGIFAGFVYFTLAVSMPVTTFLYNKKFKNLT